MACDECYSYAAKVVNGEASVEYLLASWRKVSGSPVEVALVVRT
jgi:hypothetical protein